VHVTVPRRVVQPGVIRLLGNTERDIPLVILTPHG
jgi:hypothetical protein